MDSISKQIDDLFWKIVDIAKSVKTGAKLVKAPIDPLQTYYKVAGSHGIVAKCADEKLQKVLAISLGAKEFTQSFQDTGKSHWKDATWLISNLTEGSAGAKVKNRQGILILTELQTNVESVIEMTRSADALADAIMVLVNVDIKGLANLLTTLTPAANLFVFNEIKTINKATRSGLSIFSPNINQAIRYLERL
ncbi:MAG TPA: hypothetical protein PLN21_06540 [Gemmatales bacterium]|nr:hypothetical protein [Gemmatales bacterium]